MVTSKKHAFLNYNEEFRMWTDSGRFPHSRTCALAGAFAALCAFHATAAGFFLLGCRSSYLNIHFSRVLWRVVIQVLISKNHLYIRHFRLPNFVSFKAFRLATGPAGVEEQLLRQAGGR